MVDKSNEYGYVPSSPTQAYGSNTGVFESNDIVDLINANQWSRPGQLELIETQTPSGASYVDFTNLGDYNVHFLTYNDIQSPSTAGLNGLYARYFESGVLETASVYQFARQFGSVTGSFGEGRSTTDAYINIVSGTTSATETNGYVYFYNLTDSSKYSFNTNHSFAYLGLHYMLFGTGVLPQASQVTGIRISGNINFSDTFSGTLSLYGIRYS